MVVISSISSGHYTTVPWIYFILSWVFVYKCRWLIDIKIVFLFWLAFEAIRPSFVFISHNTWALEFGINVDVTPHQQRDIKKYWHTIIRDDAGHIIADCGLDGSSNPPSLGTWSMNILQYCDYHKLYVKCRARCTVNLKAYTIHRNSKKHLSISTLLLPHT